MDLKAHASELSPLRMPAEWEPHAASWLAWPHNRDDWPGRFGPIPWVYAEIIKCLSCVEEVNILVEDAASSVLEQVHGVDWDVARVHLHGVPTDRVWTRDYGPIIVRDSQGKRVAIKWRFNAWAKYDNWHHDNAAGDAIIDIMGLSSQRPEKHGRPIVLEGGSIDVNGQGTLLTTEECLLSDVQQRNPGMSRQDYEEVFTRYLGVRKVIWLKRGIAGDDTHGHVDDLARFVNASTIVAVREDDRGDENYEPLQENWELLQAATDQDGRPLRIVPLPMPSPIYFQGQRLPASYANFYIANGLVLVPTFNDERDRQALNRVADLFPDRRVVGIYCGDLVWGLGTLHCMTMQEPA
jgi:agmatine deiminase